MSVPVLLLFRRKNENYKQLYWLSFLCWFRIGFLVSFFSKNSTTGSMCSFRKKIFLHKNSFEKRLPEVVVFLYFLVYFSEMFQF